jgi:carboxypeptidase Q
MPRLRATGLLFLSATLAAPLLISGPSFAQTDDTAAKIKDEGMARSQVMQTLSYLTDVIGPRLTGSPNMKRANEWTKEKLASWGLQNSHLEAWGPFGRGWSLERFSAQVIEPQNIPLIAFPKAWSPGFKGTLTGEVVYVDAVDEAGLEKYKGKLKGAIVLSTPLRAVAARFESQGSRYTDDQLAKMAAAEERVRGAGGAGGGRPQGGAGGRFQMTPEQRAAFQFSGRKSQFLQEEGVGLLVDAGRGDDGTIFVQSATVPAPPPAAGGAAAAPAAPAGGPGAGGGFARRVSPWDKNAPKITPQITVSSEQYNRMIRMLQQGEKLKMAVDLEVKFYDKDPMSYNTIAEIPGTDLKDEIVMLGAHMDSWHSGTGATDNAAGVAVTMEAVRILQALNLKPRRTIRIGLWSGEEEGLFGSRAYVAEHFGTYARPVASPGTATAAAGAGAQAPAPAELKTKPEYDKISGYFNLDNGTGKIRGIYLQGNKEVRTVFQDWLAPFKDLGATTVTINNTGSTDHVSFDGIGIPGFQFIQDTIEYDSRTHHSNQDVYDRAQAEDLKQASVIMAAFVYNTAIRDQKLPRKPLPGG